MDHYCVLGNPVEHSKSPMIHARFAQLTDQVLSYGKQLVALDGFALMLAQLRANGLNGCNVTVPFKFEAFKAAATSTARAELALAANTLRLDASGIHADNTDGAGLVMDLQRNAGLALAGKRILLIGAGGAAAGVLGPLLATGPRQLVLTNRSMDRAETLAARHREHPSMQNVLQKTELVVADIQALQGDFDLVINATASSLSGSISPVPASVLKPGATACDLMYGPAVEGFMQWATQHGAVPRDGLGMLVEQAAESFFIWRGIRPPAAQVLDEMRLALHKPAT